MTDLTPSPVPLRTESHTAIAPEPSNPGHDSLDVPITPLTTEREAIEYAKIQVRSGGWEDLRLKGDTRFNILIAGDALYKLAIAIADRGNEPKRIANGDDVGFLSHFAFNLGNWAATTARYVPEDEDLKVLGHILLNYQAFPETERAVRLLEGETLGFDIKPWIVAPAS